MTRLGWNFLTTRTHTFPLIAPRTTKSIFGLLNAPTFQQNSKTLCPTLNDFTFARGTIQDCTLSHCIVVVNVAGLSCVQGVYLCSQSARQNFDESNGNNAYLHSVCVCFFLSLALKCSFHSFIVPSPPPPSLAEALHSNYTIEQTIYQGFHRMQTLSVCAQWNYSRDN